MAMARVYVCDICNTLLKNPYDVHMREFFIGIEFDLCGGMPCDVKSRKRRVHICGDCYKALQEAGRKRAAEEAE
jgi:hypothetical protein